MRVRITSKSVVAVSRSRCDRRARGVSVRTQGHLGHLRWVISVGSCPFWLVLFLSANDGFELGWLGLCVDCGVGVAVELLLWSVAEQLSCAQQACGGRSLMFAEGLTVLCMYSYGPVAVLSLERCRWADEDQQGPSAGLAGTLAQYWIRALQPPTDRQNRFFSNQAGDLLPVGPSRSAAYFVQYVVHSIQTT